MPFITVLTLGDRTDEQRRQFAAAVTRLAVEFLGAREREVRVRFEEMDASHFAWAGRLAADGPPGGDGHAAGVPAETR
jgi:4-oxalocrotonate tautomerase family enzyme